MKKPTGIGGKDCLEPIIGAAQGRAVARCLHPGSAYTFGLHGQGITSNRESSQTPAVAIDP